MKTPGGVTLVACRSRLRLPRRRHQWTARRAQSHRWREWTDPRFVVLVPNNQDLNQVTWEMRAMAGDTRYEASQDLPAMNFAAFADLLGLRGIRVERPEEIAGAFEYAFTSDRPVVIDVLVDPDVPPLPPHITLQQAKAFMMSVLKGDSERAGFVKQAIEHLFPSIGVSIGLNRTGPWNGIRRPWS